MVAEFFQVLSSAAVPNLVSNGLKWNCNKVGVFNSKSFYTALNNRSGVLFSWKSVWKVKAPSRVAFFIWLAAWGKIFTCDNLMRRGYTMAGWCCMCQCVNETVDHLLIHCSAIQILSNFVFRAFRIHWILPRRVLELLCGWWNWFGRHQSNIWNLIPHCLMWMVWRERNSRTFEDKKKSANQFLGSFVESFFEWARAWSFIDTITVHDFVAGLHVDLSFISVL